MPAATVTPVLVSNVPTSLTTVTTGPAAGKEWKLTIRVANKTSGPIKYRLGMYLTSASVSAISYGVYYYNILPEDARDIEINLPLGTGYTLAHLAEATGLDMRMTGFERSTT